MFLGWLWVDDCGDDLEIAECEMRFLCDDDPRFGHELSGRARIKFSAKYLCTIFFLNKHFLTFFAKHIFVSIKILLQPLFIDIYIPVEYMWALWLTITEFAPNKIDKQQDHPKTRHDLHSARGLFVKLLQPGGSVGVWGSLRNVV